MTILLVFTTLGCGYLLVYYNLGAKSQLEDIATETLGVKVTIGELHMNLDQGIARLGHIQIYNPVKFSGGAVVQIENVDIIIDTWEKGVIRFREIDASGVKVNLEVLPDRDNLMTILAKMSKRKADRNPSDIEKIKVEILDLKLRDIRIRLRAGLKEAGSPAPIVVQDYQIPVSSIQIGQGMVVRTAIKKVWADMAEYLRSAAQNAGFMKGMVPSTTIANEEERASNYEEKSKGDHAKTEYGSDEKSYMVNE